MKTPLLILRGLAAAFLATWLPPLLAAANDAAKPKELELCTPDKIVWQNGPGSLEKGAQFAVLEGDPRKEGPFVMRLKLPDGFHIRPHTHPKTERVTVISGTFVLAMGDKLDRASATPLMAGTYGYWPTGTKHAAWAQGETVLQLHGMGPWIINYIIPADDPRTRK